MKCPEMYKIMQHNIRRPILDDEVRDIEKEFEEIHIIHTDFNIGFDNEKLQETIKKGKNNEVSITNKEKMV